VRAGDFGVEVIGRDTDLREADSGHVLARPGAVYEVRLRNFGPLRCVVALDIDGKCVSGNGLVLQPYGVCTLERPVDASEHGRFTVVAEGDERVFGPDGGRDNPNLGLIEASFRRELPQSNRDHWFAPDDFAPRPMPAPPSPAPPSRIQPVRPTSPRPPEWENRVRINGMRSAGASRSAPVSHPPHAAVPMPDYLGSIQSAAGTGLTGHSSQEFFAVSVGPLEMEATTLRLRLVIASEEDICAPRPLPSQQDAPARPAARP
jgi:hypothetical protein